jgi:hypothetical protein
MDGIVKGVGLNGTSVRKRAVVVIEIEYIK